ncbi:hypothetical protein D9756_007167 [Leucocoprinus leucothites]|uniref:Uncharacterized protein n=1 Tax=Leucocoprinus leucothites TaxID=201217 RepID=A0A8H5D7K7_9AGAR|nr:hypothetical protein D9756_007167 [Leucoagaricus leucothites]
MPCNVTTSNWNKLIGTDYTFAGHIAGYMVEIFLYGINLVTFSTAAYTLVHNLKGNTRWILLTSASVMFVFSTMNTSLTIYVVFGYMLRRQGIPIQIIRVRHSLYFVNNLIADMLLLYRCYAIWSHSIRVIIVPCICLLASFGLGIFYVGSSLYSFAHRRYIYMWMALTFNIVVTALNATRIWWMARETRKAIGPILARKYYSAMVIIIESGAIYSIYSLIDQVLKTVVGENLVILDAGLAQVVAIAPNLIIMQIGLGRQARDLESTIQTGRETGETVVLTTVHSHC